MSEEIKRFLAAKAVVKNPEGNFLILREGGNYEEGTNIGKWDVPGGRLEEGETLFDGLARETREETGLEIVVDKLLDAQENFPIIKGQKVHIVRLYYLCRPESGEVTLSEDHDKYAWVSKEELPSYEIMDPVEAIIRKI